MPAANTFESFVDDLSRAWMVDAGLAFLTGMLQGRLAARVAAESTPYVPAPGARNALLHSEYSAGNVTPGSDLAVSLGGSPR